MPPQFLCSFTAQFTHIPAAGGVRCGIVHDFTGARLGEGTMKKIVIFATAFGLAIGPATSYAAVNCGNSADGFFPVLGNTAVSAVDAMTAVDTQMTQIMVCNPSGVSSNFQNQEWTSGPTARTFNEFSDPARVPYGTYSIGYNLGGPGSRAGTITYLYTGGGSFGPYMISTNGNIMYFCNSSQTLNNTAVDKTSFKTAASVTSCP
jgi:hypothetical protein